MPEPTIQLSDAARAFFAEAGRRGAAARLQGKTPEQRRALTAAATAARMKRRAELKAEASENAA